MVFSPQEIFDIIIMTAAVGFIFSDVFGNFQPRRNYDPLQTAKRGFDFNKFLFAAAITAPAIILHEFGHKFVALSFGLEAEFNAAYFWLGIGVLLKLLNFGFIFFVPAFVAISGNITPFTAMLTSFAGPGVNLFLWLGATLAVKKKLIPGKYVHIALLTAKINMFLFIFNMIPFPGFDGNTFFLSLLELF